MSRPGRRVTFAGLRAVAKDDSRGGVRSVDARSGQPRRLNSTLKRSLGGRSRPTTETANPTDPRIRRDFPSIRLIGLLGGKMGHWRLIPADSPTFESEALQACELLLKQDARFGHVPQSRKTLAGINPAPPTPRGTDWYTQVEMSWCWFFAIASARMEICWNRSNESLRDLKTILLCQALNCGPLVLLAVA
jgi:hypothetical protein